MLPRDGAGLEGPGFPRTGLAGAGLAGPDLPGPDLLGAAALTGEFLIMMTPRNGPRHCDYSAMLMKKSLKQE